MVATDGDIVKLCRQIDNHQDAIMHLISQVEESGHSNADKMTRALLIQCHQPACASHVIRDHLNDPSRWESRDGSLYHIAASRAVRRLAELEATRG